MGEVIRELIGKKVVVYVEVGSSHLEHRGVLEAADGTFLKLKKDIETLYIVIYNIAMVKPV